MNELRASTAALVFIFLLPSFMQAKVIRGSVVDEHSKAVAGATIRVSREGMSISGTSADSLGRYFLEIPEAVHDSLLVTAGSLGFLEKSISLMLRRETTILDFQLTSSPLDIGTVFVTPDTTFPEMGFTLDKNRIEHAARYSPIPSNPIEAIKLPQALREGSNLSSKLSIYGSNPRYFINGVDIGSNPNHYGIFSIVPASVISAIDFRAEGAGAQYGEPAIISLTTPAPFERHLTGQLNLSIIESNGFISYGADRYFVLSSVRKSILDEISEYINYRPDRLQLPPADFRDFFVSAGIRLSRNQRLFVDHYYVEDDLRYQSGPTIRNPGGFDSSQKTNRRLIAVRFEAIDNNLIFKAAGALKINDETYRASPTIAQNSDAFAVNLHAAKQVNQGDFELTFLHDGARLTIGDQFAHTAGNDIELQQHNWNFRPPDDISDNPYIYQEALNCYYGAYQSTQTRINNAGYCSYDRLFEHFEIQAGLRAEYFGGLARRWKIAFRSTAIIPALHGGAVKVSFGNYAEDPASDLMKPYQVLIDRFMHELRPIETRLFDLNIGKGALDVGIFAKDIRRIPQLVPDFNFADPDSATDARFLKMESAGRLRFAGARITYENNRLISNRLHLLVFYCVNDAMKFTQNLELPYELASRHRFYSEAEFKVNRILNVGADLAIHSGFRFTPSYPEWLFQIEGRYTRQFYDLITRLDNSQNFRTNIIINVHAGFDYDKISVFFSVANITNYANPIINTADGFIYDAGILPSVGLSLKF